MQLWIMAERHEDRHLERLKRTLASQLAWGPADSWHSKMFDELSERIFQDTEVLLSPATLKRFFGVVSHTGKPSITTLDTLSRFVGKENWTDFKLKGSKVTVKRPKLPRKSIYVSIGFVLAIVIISVVGSRRPPVVVDPTEFRFSSTVLSREYPNSVVFQFQIPESVDTDSLHIQQSWDRTKTVSIRRDQTEATGIYYFPGYFRARLMVEGQNVMSHDLFLKSDGWLGMVEYEPVPKYFTPSASEHSLLATPVEIQKQVASSSDPLMTTYQLVDDFGKVSGDDFTFQASVGSVFSDRWAVCQSLYVFFLGTDGALIIPFSKVGCSSDNNVMLNDKFLSGKEHDLSAFAVDFTAPENLHIQVQDRRVQVRIGDRLAFDDTYQETMGRLVGVRFKFLGYGEVLSMSVLDQSNQELAFF